VILLPNHRWPYFWYIPFLGIAGLFGLGAREASHWLRRQQIPLRRLAVIHLALLIAWSTVNNTVEYLRSRKVRAVQAGHANTFTAYVRTLNKLDPEPDATLYFVEAPPRFFSTDVLNSSVQVALHRPDLHARLVDKFPEGTKWKLLLSKGEVQRSIEDEVIRKTGAEQSPDPILTSDAEPPRPEPKPCFSSPIQRLLRNLTGGG
jgi:hypothetical protein